MSRRPRESRTEVEQAVAAAERGVEQALGDLTAARQAYVEAESAYIDKGTKATLERKRDCADALERAEALQRRAQERLDQARAAMAEVVREEQWGANSSRCAASSHPLARRCGTTPRRSSSSIGRSTSR